MPVINIRNQKMFIIWFSALLVMCAAMSSVHAVEGGCVHNAYTCDGPDKEITYGPCDSTVCTFCPKTSLAYKTMCEKEETSVELEGVQSWLDKIISYIENAIQSLLDHLKHPRNCITSALGNPPSCSDNNNVCEPTTVNNRLLGNCMGVSTDNQCIPCQNK